MTPPVLAPEFARLSDYFGLWCYEPLAFAGVWALHAETDLVRHAAAAPPRRTEGSLEFTPGKGGQSVAVVRMAGTLMKHTPSMGGTSTVQLRRDVRAAAQDDKVSGILLSIDSPGGTVAGTYELAAEVKAARRKKPVWAHVDDLAASAAYWVASQADAVYAGNPTAQVGSIGTFQVVYDLSKQAEAEGVRPLVFKTGPLKGGAIPGAPVSDEQAAYYQRNVDGVQEHFDAAVRAGRGLSAEELKAVRSGGVFPAAEAAERRLIDGIKGLDATLAALAGAR